MMMKKKHGPFFSFLDSIRLCSPHLALRELERRPVFQVAHIGVCARVKQRDDCVPMAALRRQMQRRKAVVVLVIDGRAQGGHQVGQLGQAMVRRPEHSILHHTREASESTSHATCRSAHGCAPPLTSSGPCRLRCQRRRGRRRRL